MDINTDAAMDVNGNGTRPVSGRCKRENPFKVMYIMATVDIPRGFASDDNPRFYEVPLCSVKAYTNRNLIEVCNLL